jgi:hypothetical protein
MLAPGTLEVLDATPAILRATLSGMPAGALETPGRE